MGYGLFDCVIPTREARHQRLYVFADGMETPEGVRSGAKFYRFHYAMDEKNVRDPRPVDEHCNCELCKNHSRAYLHPSVPRQRSAGDALAGTAQYLALLRRDWCSFCRKSKRFWRRT